LKWKKETQNHTHSRIHKINNKQVKVHVNTLCIPSLCAKCGIKIVSWGLPWIYVEPNAFEICAPTTRDYAPCKGAKFIIVLITKVCMWPSPTPLYLGLLPLTITRWHRFELIDVIWWLLCCGNVGEGCEDTIDKVLGMPNERWPKGGLPHTTLCDGND